jgi:hypothetical protein
VKPGQPPAPLAGAGQYLGCFKDQGAPAGTEGRDLNGSISNNTRMTTASCANECRAKNFAYAGTQYSSYCFCGNSYGKSGGANNCNMKCAGNPGETCGGAWANSVYATGAAPVTAAAKPAQPPTQALARGCALAGTWAQTAEGLGSSTWTISSSGEARESGLGNAKGTAALAGKTLRIDWSHPNGWSGFYEWNLQPNCNSGSGKVVFKSGGSGTRISTVTRQ